MLKMTKVELETFSNPDINLFTEKGMKGGISYASKRYRKANNENCLDYDKEKPENHINYIDMNNLYGGAMSEYLPYGWFKWLKTTNKTINRILNKKDNSLHGYFLEVDLGYRENLYEVHSDFPMADNVRIFKLLYSDADSFIYEVGENFYEIMHKHKEVFDLSNQSKDSKYYCNDNKQVPGKMEDEYGGTPIYENLKSKMYLICDVKNNEKSILKGHNSYISNNEYRDVLQHKKILDIKWVE